MDMEKLTERARGFVQAAQTIAIREQNQQLETQHLLKALLDDREGLAASLLTAAGANARQAADEAAIVLGNKIDNAILDGKDINAIKDAAKREGGTANRVSQLLDSFGQTNTRTRRAAITAVDTGDTAPLLDELMKTSVKREVAAQTISTIKQHRANTGDDITAALGGKDVREALAPLRALDDRGLAALKNAVEGGPSLGNDVADGVEAILTKTTRRIYSYNQEFWDNNPRLYDAMGKDLQRRIVNFENSVGAPLQGAAGGTLQKAKLASMGVQDVVSGVIAPWAETQIKVLGLAGALGQNARETSVSLGRTAETMGRLSLISGFENLAPMEETISKAYAAAQEFRGAVDTLGLKKSLFNKVVGEEMSAKGGYIEQMIPIFHKYLTHEEIKGLLTFYTSPLGKKATSVLPMMAQEGMQVGQRWAKTLGPKLDQRLKARFAERGIKIEPAAKPAEPAAPAPVK